MKNSQILSQLYAFTTVLLWSTAYVFTKISLQYFSTASLGLLRCAIASIVLMGIVVIKKMQPPGKKCLPLFILSGATGFTLYIMAFNIGSSLLNATTSCVIISTSPIITAVLATVIFKEKLNARQWLATGLAFCGIIIIALWDSHFSVSAGLVWMLGAAALISIYNILQRGLSRLYSAMQITAYSFSFGTLMLMGFLPETAEQLHSAPQSQIWLVCFLGIFPSAAAYAFWGKALALAPQTSSVTNYMFLTPFLALILEYIVMGTLPGRSTFIGGGVILSGLFLFTAAKEK